MLRPMPTAAELCDRVLALSTRHERRGKALPYTSANGHMYSFVSADGEVCLRLSTKERQDFHDRHRGGEVVQHGRVMKEYVAVPAELLAETERLAPYLAKSYDYAKGLKPKSTTRRPRASSYRM